jgi:hypothetical protein
MWSSGAAAVSSAQARYGMKYLARHGDMSIGLNGEVKARSLAYICQLWRSFNFQIYAADH